MGFAILVITINHAFHIKIFLIAPGLPGVDTPGQLPYPRLGQLTYSEIYQSGTCMAENATRQNIILEADKLFYHWGYNHTSFADIAGVVGISRGNFYHHFKTKDDILAAVISMRFDRTKEMLEQWEQQAKNPQDRIKSFINILIVNQTRIMQHGCPVGSLCVELAKLNHASQEHANEIFLLFKHWLRRQFMLLGCKSNADTLAMHVLARSQGIAVMASTIADTKFINHEVNLLYKWVEDCA